MEKTKIKSLGVYFPPFPSCCGKSWVFQFLVPSWGKDEGGLGRTASCPWPLSCGGADPEAALYWKPQKSRSILQLNKLREPLSAAPASPNSHFCAQQQLGRLQKLLSGSSRDVCDPLPASVRLQNPRAETDTEKVFVGADPAQSYPRGKS